MLLENFDFCLFSASTYLKNRGLLPRKCLQKMSEKRGDFLKTRQYGLFNDSIKNVLQFGHKFYACSSLLLGANYNTKLT